MQVQEAGLQKPTVVVEFDSYDIARLAHESEAYQKALQALGTGAAAGQYSSESPDEWHVWQGLARHTQTGWQLQNKVRNVSCWCPPYRVADRNGVSIP